MPGAFSFNLPIWLSFYCLLWVSGLNSVVSLARVTNTTLACNDADSCMALHLSNSEFTRMLSNRCNLEVFSGRFNKNRNITFTHLPKTGGSSVRVVLTKTAARRTGHIDHEHFLQAFHDGPSNLFATMLREPVSRAISFYAYVQEVKKMTAEKRENKLWSETFRAKGTKWANSTFIQRTLATDPLGFFLTDVRNIEDSITRFNYTALRQLPPVSYNDAIAGTAKKYAQYASTLPAAYQCKQHLEVAFILLKQYEVVGTLEQNDDFYTTLLRRAHFPLTHTNITKITSVHANPTKYKINKAEKQQMKEALVKALYCGRVLWKIAGMISDADMKCA